MYMMCMYYSIVHTSYAWFRHACTCLCQVVGFQMRIH